MNADPLDEIEAAFGWREFPGAMFYEAPFALRFELGEQRETKLLCFIEALYRARTLASALFAGSVKLKAIVSIVGEQRATSRHSAALRQLRELGFRHPFGPATKVPQHDHDHIAAFGGDVFRHWRCASFDKDDASMSALLWASAAKEMAIAPKARWIDTIHIVDLDNRLALTAYDDRGLDMVAPSADYLLPLHRKFDAWLLDYDRAEMNEKLSGRR